MEGKVRIGVLGCANIAERLSLPAILKTEGAELVSVASRTRAKAEEWAARFGARAEDSYDAQIAAPDIDAVYIPLPIGLHREWALKAAEAGKHVICEKSLAENLDSAKGIIAAARKAGVVLFENFACGYHPQHGAVRAEVAKGTIGKPFLFRGAFGFPPFDKSSFRYDKSLGGSCLYEVGAYPVFMARKILGAEPQKVYCTLFYDVERGVDIKGNAQIEFPNELVAEVAFSMDSVYQNNYSLWGQKGLLRTSRAFAIPADMVPPLELLTNENFKETVVPVEAPAAAQFELIFADFCDVVRSGDAARREGMYETLLAQARTLEALRISAKEGRAVALSEFQ
ncbi:MAG: hypothetical protein A2901_04745 [Elusimicrobia bacterium RIFCSPLOWO2_01_FULL_54_10]|nr:MAG: hypothetical protein A2901_04745 [Elusimicrobia bacterium RIFCSPLOWO2_01_FULL_54_10]